MQALYYRLRELEAEEQASRLLDLLKAASEIIGQQRDVAKSAICQHFGQHECEECPERSCDCHTMAGWLRAAEAELREVNRP